MPPCVRDGDVDPELVLQRIKEALAILHAVEQGALFGEPPRNADGRKRHHSGLVLLDVLQEKLERLGDELEATQDQATRVSPRRHAPS